MSETIKTSPNRHWNDKAYRENFPKDMGKEAYPSFIDAYENIIEKEA